MIDQSLTNDSRTHGLFEKKNALKIIVKRTLSI